MSYLHCIFMSCATVHAHIQHNMYACTYVHTDYMFNGLRRTKIILHI